MYSFVMPLCLMAPLVFGAAQAPDDLKAETTALLAECQDATYNLDFDHAEALAHNAMLQAAQHPLPRIFLQLAILGRVQESIGAGEDDPALFARYQRESDAALILARQFELDDHDARSQLYLGMSLGVNGMAKMINGQYLKAYHDGQAAALALHSAVDRDPAILDAYLGLGQYDYYCGRLGGFLRFAANLHGDIKGGIAMLETCGAQGGVAATAARINLARIYSLEVTDFAKALPYVLEMRRRYPGNYAFVHEAMAMGRGDGCKNPAFQALLESVFAQWDLGWRPPDYAHIDIERSRLQLARAYAQEGSADKAERHFSILAKSKDADVALAGRKGREK